jgi:hypothetical protein
LGVNGVIVLIVEGVAGCQLSVVMVMMVVVVMVVGYNDSNQ